MKKAGFGVDHAASVQEAKNAASVAAYDLALLALGLPDSDFLYDSDLADWRTAGRTTQLVTAVSRISKPQYVQDALRQEGEQLGDLIRSGARIMVCGGRDMAAGVADALANVLAPMGLPPAALKAQGRYVEDV